MKLIRKRQQVMTLPRGVGRPSDLQIDSTGSISHGNQPMNEMEDIDSAETKPRAEDQIEETNMNNSELYPVQKETDAKDDAPYCSLSERRKISVMLIASFSGIISPISASIYYPALPSLANDMHVSISLINLTITTYLILQGISPSFTGSFSDVYGRRIAYMFCFTTYIGANIGLALQSDYAALMVLRCVQAAGSSGTIAIGSAVVADISTRAERGRYIAYATMGTTLGPAVGPVIGGLLDHFLGWRWVFWFLVILGGFNFALILVTCPETCRAVVGNGSIPPAKWNRPLWATLKESLRPRSYNVERRIDYETLEKSKTRPNPLTSVRIALEKEGGLILIYGALLYAGYMIILSTLTSQLESEYGFNSIQVGLCYLPLGVGSLTSRWSAGPLLDWNFKREAKLQNLPIVKNRQQDIRDFDIEKTRTLIVDIHRQSAATAVAANNLFRCLLAAGATAFATPLIDRISIGWTTTFILPNLFLLYLLIMSLNRAAYLLAARKTPLEVREAPYPSPDPGTIVVRNHAVAINPIDWKLQNFEILPLKYPFILGVDVAGEVIAVGSGVTNFTLGQRVIGCVVPNPLESSYNQTNKHCRHCKNLANGDNRYSGFQDFTVLSATLAAPLPPSISYEKAVVLPVSTILIWGGSSSVGISAVQLAHAAGVEVITTASPHNHALLRDLGVSQIYDHRSPTVVDDIVAALENKHVVGAYDCISEDQTQRACAEILERSKAARKVLVYTNDVVTPEGLPSSVTVRGIFCLTVENNEVGPAVWANYLPKALECGHFKPMPEPLVVGTGLEHIQTAIERNLAGLSAAKAVVKLF
ncbi:putative MFS transporter [Aspergillus bombycis]|uniref:Putative MFS transporter n=1 Tax=Aspergillus bombycis TaxID=109264 RepID=A0A1F7ZMA4_9EURO|nr:putative MFS transporter [Aspergillus bombycis]OGM40596.1 putative MFS transporter [Aspergillus bombycis]